MEVIASGEPDTVYEAGGARMVLTKPYAITSFDSALYRLPPVEVTVDGKTYRSATPLALKVNTVRVDTPHTDQSTGPHAPAAHLSARPLRVQCPREDIGRNSRCPPRFAGR